MPAKGEVIDTLGDVMITLPNGKKVHANEYARMTDKDRRDAGSSDTADTAKMSNSDDDEIDKYHADSLAEDHAEKRRIMAGLKPAN